MAGYVNIKYFALLREKTGLSEERFPIDSDETGITLYRKLCEKYDFPLTLDQVMLVVNENYASKDSTLEENDCVVFIPPVAGG
ncbi:MAG: MoaD/ThiS family protein [Oligoflexales bacterium]|nr:MoaD/ThiS family protein [Oligoflexales bacterium]